MNKFSARTVIALAITVFIFSKCNVKKTGDEETNTKDSVVAAAPYGGYKTQVKFGEHLVSIAGCHDCHTPKKMGPSGPEMDFSLALSGHPAQMPAPDIDRKEVESKGLAVTNDLTAWVGPWGISYAANITSDSTGIGTWSEEQFLVCIREGKWMGLKNERTMLPPMPWREMGNMTDEELKAIFAYLKTTTPVHNVVPMVQPPLSAPNH